MTVTVQLIRHGKTKGNLEKRFTGGRTDDSLCNQGLDELKNLVKDNIYYDFNEVFASPMKRCLETASTIFSEKEITVIDSLREIDFGIFENKNHQELNGSAEYQNWIDSNGKSDIPSGEKMKDFECRTMEGFYKALSVRKGDEISFVIHGGSIMAILSFLCGGNYYDYMCTNGRGYVFDFNIDERKVVSLRKI